MKTRKATKVIGAQVDANGDVIEYCRDAKGHYFTRKA